MSYLCSVCFVWTARSNLIMTFTTIQNWLTHRNFQKCCRRCWMNVTQSTRQVCWRHFVGDKTTYVSFTWTKYVRSEYVALQYRISYRKLLPRDSNVVENFVFHLTELIRRLKSGTRFFLYLCPKWGLKIEFKATFNLLAICFL